MLLLQNTSALPKAALALPVATHWYQIQVGGILCALALHFLLVSLLPQPAIFGVARADWPLVAALIFCGIPLTLQIILKLARGDFGADLLALLALSVGVWLAEYLAATLIILMLAGGKMLETYATRKASSALRLLADRMPAHAHRQQGAQLIEIPITDIRPGDEIVIFPHETAPVDGVVVSGQGAMDESYLTGEPYHVAKAPGASVLSGAINGAAVLVMRAEKLAQDSRYAQIVQVLQAAELRRPNSRRLADQLGGAFAALAVLFAIAVWYFSGDATRLLAVLVVATPCPLLLAIPITMISAISMAARLGIVIRDPAVLERLPTCRTAIFDKTGTLTYGKPELTEIITAPDIDKNQILQLAASLERYSKHPLAAAIMQAATAQQLPILAASSVSEKPGQGLTGMVNGQAISVTNRKKLLQNYPAQAATLPPTAAGLECILLLHEKYAATLRFRDSPRADGQKFIGHLGSVHQFSKIMLVSGDRDSEVTYLASLLGISESLAAQSPEQKVAVVRAATANAPTLFMGDGINDAPALATATVGIAFGQHSSVTAEAAGAVILENSLAKVDQLLHLSIAMRRIMLQSAIGGMMLSIVAMGFAASGHITPVQGALLQEGIDILAILNALRLTWDKKIFADLRSEPTT